MHTHTVLMQSWSIIVCLILISNKATSSWSWLKVYLWGYKKLEWGFSAGCNGPLHRAESVQVDGGPRKGHQLSRLLMHEQREGELGAGGGLHLPGGLWVAWGKSGALVAITTQIQRLLVQRLMGIWVDGWGRIVKQLIYCDVTQMSRYDVIINSDYRILSTSKTRNAKLNV